MLKWNLKGGRKMEEQKTLTPVKAIRAKCIECSGGNRSEADRCQIKDCPLYNVPPRKEPKQETPRDDRRATRENAG